MSNREKDKRFGEVGIELGFFTREDFNRVTLLQKTDEAIGVNKPIGVYLLNENKVTKQQIEKIVAIEDKFEQPVDHHVASSNVVSEYSFGSWIRLTLGLVWAVFVSIVCFAFLYIGAYFWVLGRSKNSLENILVKNDFEFRVMDVSQPINILFLSKSEGTVFLNAGGTNLTVDFTTTGNPFLGNYMVEIPVSGVLKLKAMNFFLPDKAKSEISATNLSRPIQPVTSVAEKSIKKSGYRKDTRLVDVSFVCNDQKFEFTRVKLFEVTYEYSTPVEMVADGDIIIELINEVASMTSLAIDREKTRRRFEDEICFNSASNKLVVLLATKE